MTHDDFDTGLSDMQESRAIIEGLVLGATIGLFVGVYIGLMIAP